MSVSTRIKEAARRLGFFKAGIARAEPFPRLHFLEEWLADRKQGEMAWLERTKEKRQNPALVLPNVRSILMVGMNYYIPGSLETPNGEKISRYAWGEDYHLIMEDKLKQLTEIILSLLPSARARYYADTGPVMEKAWAQKAGVGWIGKNTNLISPGHGSYLFLGEVLLDQELDYDEPGVDLCGSCSLCIQACPTGALAPYSLDSNKCISYLTIEKKGDLPPELRAGIGEWVYGCDDCQEVCPWNASPESAREPGFYAVNPYWKELSPRNLQEENFNRMFKKSPVKRIKFKGLLRNLEVVHENQKRLHHVRN